MTKQHLMGSLFTLAMLSLLTLTTGLAKPRKATLPGEIVNVTFDLSEEPDVAAQLLDEFSTSSELTLYIGKFYDGKNVCYVNLKSEEFSCAGI